MDRWRTGGSDHHIVISTDAAEDRRSMWKVLPVVARHRSDILLFFSIFMSISCMCMKES